MSALRDRPFALLFPVGLLLAWVGTGHWLLFALDASEWRPVFHSIVQIEGFLGCFAAGFLFTMVPRRLQARGPATWQILLAAGAPLITAAMSWLKLFGQSQGTWIAVLLMLTHFMRSRVREGNRTPPACFVWIGIGLLHGFAGTAIIGAYGMAGLDFVWHELGQLILLQGMFLSLIVGVGGMAIPLMTRGMPTPDGGSKAAHWIGGSLLVATFCIESLWNERLGLALRCALTLALLIRVAKLHRLPTKTGTHRWLIWLSAWCIPVGYGLAAAWPATSIGGLHVVFIGGFALMALAVGAHVSTAHGTEPARADAHSWSGVTLGVLIALAMSFRFLVTSDPERLQLWLGLAAGSFLAATTAWAWTFRKAF